MCAYRVPQKSATCQGQIASISNKIDLHRIHQWTQIKDKRVTIFFQCEHCIQQNVRIYDFQYKSAPSWLQLSFENEAYQKLGSGKIVNDILWKSLENHFESR